MSEAKEIKKIKIQEKIELKEIEVQGDQCKNNAGVSCKYGCCEDCKTNGKPSSYQSSKY